MTSSVAPPQKHTHGNHHSCGTLCEKHAHGEREQVSNWECALGEIDFPSMDSVFGRNLVHKAHALLRSTDLAEDAVQEAFLAFWKEHPKPDRPEQWLAAAVRLRSLQMLRSQRRRSAREAEYTRLKDSHRASSDPEACPLCREEELELLHQTLDQLVPADARLLSRFYFEGASHLELADEMGVRMGTIGSRLHRAKAALREAMHDADCEVPSNRLLHEP